MGNGGFGVLVAVAIAVAFFIALYAMYLIYKCCYGRDVNASELSEPLMDNANAHRLDAALREARAGHVACYACGFENFQQTSACSICGEALPVVSSGAAGAAAGASKTQKQAASAQDTAQVLQATGADTRRLKRARRRKEWTRRMDARTGRLVWHRDRSNGVDMRFPGYAVLFQPTGALFEPEMEPVPECTPEVTVVVHSAAVRDGSHDGDGDGDGAATAPLVSVAGVRNETHVASASAAASAVSAEPAAAADPTSTTTVTTTETTARLAPALVTTKERTQQLLALFRSTQLEVTDASVADPRLLPLTHLSDARLRWSEVLAMSTQAFPAKHAHFVTTTAALIVPAEREVIKLNVARASLFADSMASLSALPSASIRSVMRVHFEDEAGVDAGGLQREWFVLVNERLADAASGVFTCTNKAEQTFYLNPNSQHDVGDDHLAYYFAAGRLIGRALLEGVVIGFHLSLPLLKIMLGLPVTFSDLEYFDPELYKNLLWIMDNDGVDALGLDFSVTEQRGGDVVVLDLIPNGRSIDLTDDNKDEYLERRFRYVLFESVASQLAAFLSGFYDVLPQELLMVFDPEEFDYLLCGSDEIDVDDWEKHTQVSSDLRGHPALVWFWEIVHEMPNEYRHRLLHFATGSSRVPIAGFSALTSYDGHLCPFTLKGVPLKDEGYIWSHACFNRLDLPLHVVRRDLKAVLFATLNTELYGFTTD